MKLRINLPLALDTLFAGLCAFLLFFTAVRYYTKSAMWGLVFGIAAALLFGALAFIYISGKQSKNLLLSRDENGKRLLALHLSLSDENYIKKLLKDMLGESSEIRGRKIRTDDGFCFYDFKMRALNEDDVARVIKARCGGKKRIYCCKIAPEALSLAEHFGIDVVQIGGVYEALKEKGLLPEKYAYESEAKTGFFKRLKAAFSRKLCAPAFWSGAALLFLSYFSFFPVYYIVSGSILLIISAVALVLNRE